jgi:AraC-like DNA-binding protein
MGPVRDLADTVILLGALQGFALAAVLAVRRNNRLANRILAALTGAVALMLLLGYAQGRWAWNGYPHLLALDAPLPFLFGPLLYLYIAALTRPFVRFEARWLVHGLPFVAFVIYMTQAFYLKGGAEKIVIARDSMQGRAPISYYIVIALELVQAISYLLISWLTLRRYGKKMQGYFSDLTRMDLRWLSIIVMAHIGVWSIVILSNLLRMAGVEHAVLRSFGPAIRLAGALVMFLTGYVSVWQPELAQKAQAAEVAVTSPTEEPSPAPTGKYQRNRLDDQEAAEFARKLESLMTDDEVFRDSALTLQMLADPLGATPHLLSQVLNVRIGKSFYVFVNSYRAEALKLALADRSKRERGVLELAMEVGFNSKSTLNSFFKRHTGLTPTEYRKQALQEGEVAATSKSPDISRG